MSIDNIISAATAEALKSLYGLEVEASTIVPQTTKKEFEGNLTIVVFPFLKASHKAPDATAKEIGDYLVANCEAVVKRISEVTEEYGLRFAGVTLEFPDYNNAEIDAKIILDALYAESPALSREQNNNLYLRVMDDYAHISRKSEKYKRLKQDPFFNALQVKFAYSVTCHKAQGGQWRNVFVDMGYIPEGAF